jgi:hypothetical protein
MTRPVVEALAHAGIPTIPVKVWHDGRWKKEPLVKWDQATTDCGTLEEWSRRWPDARPGIPLREVGWVAIDVDAEGLAFWEVWDGLGPRGPYSKIQTVSGGWHFVFAQPPEAISRFKWSEGVEVLGTASVLTVYDVEEILFPRVAPRAMLPEVFRKPFAGKKEACGFSAYPRIKRSAPRVVAVVDVDVTDATAALWKMDPCDWRGDYEGWFHPAGACKALGISRREFVKWSAGDPHYAADGRTVERIWESTKGAHGGAFYAALATRRIKVSAKRSLYPGVRTKPASPVHASHWLARVKGLRASLQRDQCEASLFSYACLYVEILYEEDRASPEAFATAFGLLEEDCPKLIREVGIDAVRRSIRRAFENIKRKVKQQA